MSLLKNIHIFIRAADLGSLSEAGRQDGISPATVSHRLKQLELHLGVRLITRNTRGLKLTEAGQAFYESSQDIIRAVERAESALLRINGVPRGEVRLSAPLGLGRRVIAPLVARFCEEHPNLEVRLRLSDHPVDMIREGIDLSLRLGLLEDSSLIARKLADCPKLMCASPKYLARRGTPMLPNELLDHECISLRSFDLADQRWLLQVDGSTRPILVRSQMRADDSDVLVRWALAGCGIVMRPWFEIAEHITDGRLVEVLPEYRAAPETLSLVYPDRALLPAKTRLLLEFIVRRIGKFLELDHGNSDDAGTVARTPFTQKISHSVSLQ